MNKIEQVYCKLQRHLDKQAVGFPATRSKAELRILKHIFTPQEAQIAIHLSYKFVPLEAIFDRVKHILGSPDELKELLDGAQKKGGIESKLKGGKRHYGLVPLVVGMYEMQLKRLTPEFIKDYNEYIKDRKFGIDFISTKPPQTRTIPIAKSIQPQCHVSTFDEVAKLLEQGEAPFAVLECICRKKKVMEGGSCKITDRKETCLAIGHIAQHALLGGFGTEITRDEAMSLLEKNQKQGLVLQLSNTQKAEFICSCCGCCCGLLKFHNHLPKPVDFWVSNFHAVVEDNACDGCGACEKRCQVGAVHVRGNKQPAIVSLDRCIGCGLCVPACTRKAITLLKKSIEVRPPETREALFDIIMSNKKGRLGKLKLAGKLFVDAVKTG